MLGPWIKVNWMWPNRRWQEWKLTLGIREFKWTETGKFNSDDCYIYYCGQESLRRNGVALWVNKRVWNAVIGCYLKNNRMISVHFQDKPFNITVTQVYSLTTNAKAAEVELFHEDLQLLLELKWKKDVLFYHRELECNSRKSRDTWSNRKVWPWNTEWSRAKAKIFCHENTLVTADTLFQKQNRQLHTWMSPDDQDQNQNDCIRCSWKRRIIIAVRKTKPGADCASEHELHIAKFRLKLKKVGETTRLFRYDLYQIPYDYTVEVVNRLMGLDMLDSVWRLWTEVCNTVQEAETKPIPKKKKFKKAKWLSQEALQIAEKRRGVKGKGERKRYAQLNAELKRIARSDKKTPLSEQCKEIEGKDRMEKTRDHFKKIEDTNE